MQDSTGTSKNKFHQHQITNKAREQENACYVSDFIEVFFHRKRKKHRIQKSGASIMVIPVFNHPPPVIVFVYNLFSYEFIRATNKE
jgi:hypothetical protein